MGRGLSGSMVLRCRIHFDLVQEKCLGIRLWSFLSFAHIAAGGQAVNKATTTKRRKEDMNDET
jgi:hypothetical protein